MTLEFYLSLPDYGFAADFVSNPNVLAVEMTRTNETSVVMSENSKLLAETVQQKLYNHLRNHRHMQ